MSLEIRSESRGAARRVSLSGRLDAETSQQLEDLVTPWFADADVTHVLFDLRDLHYVSSAGLRVFILVQKALGERNGSVVIAEMQAPVAKVFEIAQALPSVSIFRNVQELDDYLDYIQRKEAGEIEE
ncbi:MAG: STAS domain-containing protein [Thermoanaerobaculia bacterium]|jgi:anti-anti-sigma factor